MPGLDSDMTGIFEKSFRFYKNTKASGRLKASRFSCLFSDGLWFDNGCGKPVKLPAPPSGAAGTVFQNNVFGVEQVADAVGFGPVFCRTRLFALFD